MEFNITNQGRKWTPKEIQTKFEDYAMDQKVELVDGKLFDWPTQFNMLGFLLENVGLDVRVGLFGDIESWERALAYRRDSEASVKAALAEKGRWYSSAELLEELGNRYGVDLPIDPEDYGGDENI